MTRLFIDPSIHSMGIAIWPGRRWKKRKSPSYTDLFRSKGNDWLQRSHYQINELKAVFNGWSPDRVYCEVPQFYETHKGMASQRSGSIGKLCVFVGMVVQLFGEERIRLVTPNEWKGQLPKKIVTSRIRKILGVKECKKYRADIWDAVGIGLWKMGLL